MYQILQNLTLLLFVSGFAVAVVVLPLMACGVFCAMFRPKCKIFDELLDVLVGKLFPRLMALEVVSALLVILAEFLAAR